MLNESPISAQAKCGEPLSDFIQMPSFGDGVLDKNVADWYEGQWRILLGNNHLALNRTGPDHDAALARKVAEYFPLRIRPTNDLAPHDRVDCWATTVIDAETGDYYTAELFGPPLYSQAAGNAFCEFFSPRYRSEFTSAERCMFVTTRRSIECNALYLWNDDALTIPSARALEHERAENWFRSWLASLHPTDYASSQLIASFNGTHFLNSHPHVRMGVPLRYDGSPAVSSTEMLMVKPEFVVLHDSKRRTPSWVSYHLKNNHIGGQPRLTNSPFKNDSDFPAQWPQAQESDFANLNGTFHRGHLCRSSDRSGAGIPAGFDMTLISSSSQTWGHRQLTDVYTNVIPQYSKFNSGPWRQFEDFLQKTVVQEKGKEVYVLVIPSKENAPTDPTIGDNNLPVPKVVYRIGVIVDANQGASSINANTEVIEIRMPNTNNYPKLYEFAPDGMVALEQWNGYWTKFIVSVHQIESETGFRLFENIIKATGNEDLAEDLRTRTNDVDHYLPKEQILPH